MNFFVNGEKKSYEGDPERSLLSYLREELGLISPKDGCAPQATCGCCSVQVGAKAMLSCATPMKKVEGQEILTTEGFSEKLKDVFVDAFLAKGGIQCGFCTPGIVMQAKVLLEQNPDPTREQVVKGLNQNLCRCTGYVKIVDAIMAAAEALREGKEIAFEETNGKVGTRLPKYGCDKAVLGLRPYVCDLKEPGMEFGAIKFSDHPRAKVLSIDTGEAEKLEGVSRVITAKDIPGERHTGLIVKDWPLYIEEGESTRYVGDALASVVALDEATAREAVALIKVTYEVLEPLTDMHKALDPQSPQIHDAGNLLYEGKIQRGDADKALQEATYTSNGVYDTQPVDHAFMEPESCLCKPWTHEGEDGIEVLTQGQGAYEDRDSVARILGLPPERVKVIQIQNGGGFGGKEDISVQGHAALASFLLKKPVKYTLSRDESILMHPKRHPLQMEYHVGCDEKGKITALKANILGDTGAYASVGMKVLERALGHATGAYSVPNIDVVSRAVYTNNIPNGAFRGFGVPQSTFAMEVAIDDLCEQGGFDRWQMRYDNAIKDGDTTATGQIIRGGAGVRATLEALKDEFQSARYAGIACGIKNTGIGNGMPDIGRAKIVIESAQRVVVHHGWTEMGQGVHTMALQTLCEETGLPPELIEVRVDTSEETACGMTTASRGTSLVGNAVIEAAKALKEDLKHNDLQALEGRVYRGEWICDWTTRPGKEKPGEDIITHYSYSYATQVVVLDDKGKIEVVYAAHDAGKIMNPMLFEGQIEGSVHMGLGYAISEDVPQEEGFPVSTRLRKCGVLNARHMPRVVVKGVEVEDPHGPYGAKGVGEIGLVPTAGAVANALYQFDKQRRYKIPLQVRHLYR